MTLKLIETETWGEFLASAIGAKNAWKGRDDNKCLSMTDAKLWSGVGAYADALALVRDGWPEGRERMASSLAAAASARPVYRLRPSRDYDVAGMYPDVPRAIAGAPDAMVTMGYDARASAPVLRLIIPRWVSASVPQRAIENYGLAVASHIDALEAEGLRVELAMHFCCAPSTKRDKGYHFLRVGLKAAQDHMELDRLAYALAHPSVLRRLYFGRLETRADLEQHFNPGHGSPRTAPVGALDADETELSAPSHDNPLNDLYERSPEAAIEEVGRQIATALDRAHDPEAHLRPEAA